MQYDDIWQLLLDIKNSGCKNILAADDPAVLKVGWIDADSDRYWTIRLDYVRKSLYMIKSNYVEILRKSLSTIQGRSNILQTIDSIPLEKLIKMKAFW